MGQAACSSFLIRQYRCSDRAAVREICAACAWLGEPAPERIGDEFLWAEYWTRYFTDREPEHLWVAEAPDASVVGYLTGTADVHRVERFAPWLLPRLAWRVIRKRLLRRRQSRRAIVSLLRSLVSGEITLPAGVLANFPATFHCNLLSPARRCGLGSRLFETFRERMESLGVGGIHVQPLSVNRGAIRLCQSSGFRMLASRPVRAFAQADPQSIEVQTWVLPLPAVEPAAFAD